jgi:cyclase|tara:strand:- start:1481 stop:2293 length:813 start_codon:yes stop_codon:yes gene_type:complete
MLKKRLIPNIILNQGNVVQSVNFKHTNVIGNAITAVDFFNSWAVDEIIVLDVSRNTDQREKFHKIINGISKRCFVPLTVGGWIKDIEEMKIFLKEGADKICINSEAVNNNSLVEEAAKIFGTQFVVVSIDVRKNEDGEFEVFTNRGKQSTGLNPVEWAKKIEKLGGGEILLTSIENEGTKKGYNLELLKSITKNVSIPVISFGGVGNWQHFVDGINIGKADAVSAANIFHHIEHSTFNAKKFLFEAGLNVRMPEFYKLPTHRKPKYDEIF